MQQDFKFTAAIGGVYKTDTIGGPVWRLFSACGCNHIAWSGAIQRDFDDVVTEGTRGVGERVAIWRKRRVKIDSRAGCHWSGRIRRTARAEVPRWPGCKESQMTGAGGGGKTVPLGDQEPLSCDAERGVMVEPAPVATFNVPQSPLLF
jgi:hypothetical protein